MTEQEIKLVCIICPNGCTLTVTDQGSELHITGGRCKRGESYARSEMTCPMRTISSTVKTAFDDVPVLPVRVSGEFPKARISDMMKEINKVRVTKRCGIGTMLIENILGLSVNLIATSDVMMEEDKEVNQYG